MSVAAAVYFLYIFFVRDHAGPAELFAVLCFLRCSHANGRVLLFWGGFPQFLADPGGIYMTQYGAKIMLHDAPSSYKFVCFDTFSSLVAPAPGRSAQHRHSRIEGIKGTARLGARALVWACMAGVIV